ncbi:MAG TPA: helix-turn-helix transcriptional regulator [Acidobacteriaceae bacterium]|jgi:transcriptional regulator with XRE-family HTH domain|nr:helix-turn-helix transcriptional regulator [Acidobacteriaceae bacterium]
MPLSLTEKIGKMKFLELHERLRLEMWRRIDQGILSRALLASRTGLAQAHISNFLHRRRRLSLTALDRILETHALTVEELVLSGSPQVRAQPRSPEQRDAVPIVTPAIAMTAPHIPPQAMLGGLQLPEHWLASFPARRAVGRASWDRFVAVRVTAAQALPMDPVLRTGAVVVLDRHYNSLADYKPPHPNLYGIRLGAHMIFRHAAFEGGRLVLRPRALESPLDVIELAPHESPADLLIGRVCLCLSEV